MSLINSTNLASVARRVGAAVLVAVALAIVAGCSSSDNSGGDGGAVATDQTPAVESTDPPEDAADSDAPVTEAAPDGETVGDELNDADAEGDPSSSEPDGELFPDVVQATIEADGDGTFTVSATLSSPYDSPERYADAWQVLDADGNQLGIRELGHDHAEEQPFTRSQSGIAIPDTVQMVTVIGRDQISGYGGATIELPVPH